MRLRSTRRPSSWRQFNPASQNVVILLIGTLVSSSYGAQANAPAEGQSTPDYRMQAPDSMNTDISNRAKRLHDEGREAGRRGEHDKALRLFTEAMELAPQWPYPVYDRAFTHLLMNDNETALADYRKTLELAPRGFFIAFTAVDTLEREQRGELPAGLYLAYCLLESIGDEAKRRSVLEQMVAKYPSFAPGWFKLSGLTKDSRERLGMLDRGLAASPDRETGGMLKLNKASLLKEFGDHEASAALIREILEDPETPIGVEAWAKIFAGQK